MRQAEGRETRWDPTFSTLLLCPEVLLRVLRAEAIVQRDYFGVVAG